MKRTSFLVATLFAFLPIASALASEQSDKPTCQPTHPRGGWISNEDLRVGMPAGGRIVFRPGGPGFVTSEGGLGWKFLWERFAAGTLHVEGHRLDAEAPPLRVVLAKTSTDSGFQPSYLIFSQPGCWQVTGRLTTKVVSFVIAVEKVGEGPGWRQF